MNKEFVRYWEKNKGNLEDYLRTHEQGEYGDYVDLVKLIFDHVINPEISYGHGWGSCKFNTENITVIDDGDYQGTLLFILHQDTYQPSPSEYVYTYVYYGSCSGCDTLLSINCYGDGLPSAEQVEDYMKLCLHLLQHCKRMVDDEED